MYRRSDTKDHSNTSTTDLLEWEKRTYMELGEEGMLEEDLEPSLAGWEAGERLRAVGIWFGESPEGVFWPSTGMASLPVFEVV